MFEVLRSLKDSSSAIWDAVFKSDCKRLMERAKNEAEATKVCTKPLQLLGINELALGFNHLVSVEYSNLRFEFAPIPKSGFYSESDLDTIDFPNFKRIYNLSWIPKFMPRIRGDIMIELVDGAQLQSLNKSLAHISFEHITQVIFRQSASDYKNNLNINVSFGPSGAELKEFIIELAIAKSPDLEYLRDREILPEVSEITKLQDLGKLPEAIQAAGTVASERLARIAQRILSEEFLGALVVDSN